MLVRIIAIFAILCLAKVCAKPDTGSTNLVHWATRSADSQAEWTLLNAAPAEQQHRIILALKERNLDVLEQKFHEVSNPDHPNWLQHMTREDIHELTAPDDTVITQIKDWLNVHGVGEDSIRYGLASGAVEFTTDVKTINQLFNTTLSVYQHTSSSKKGLAHVGPTYLPVHLREHIEFADGLHFLPLVPTKHLKIIETDMKKLDVEINPKQYLDRASNDTIAAPVKLSVVPFFPVNALYPWYNAPDMASFTKSGVSNVSVNIEVVQFVTADRYGNEVSNNFSPNDMRIYSTIWSNSRSPSTVIVDQIIGPNDASDPQDEASLDTQAAGAWNPAASLVFENNDSDNYFYAWASRVVSAANVPQVASISYGLPEFTLASASPNSGSFDGVPLTQYLARTDTLFMKMGLRGITVLASSGDNGANDRNSGCVYDTSYQNAPFYIDVEFPASSPYVTAVASTSITVTDQSSVSPTRPGGAPVCNNFATSVFSDYGIRPRSPSDDNVYWCFSLNSTDRNGQEVAVSLANSGFTSGGGFSTHYSMPSWQSTAVNNYVTNYPDRLPTRGFFDSTKRAIPDISMYGSAFPVIQNSVFTQVGGTSLSAPLVGSIVTQLNTITRQRTGKTLGFINPLLYRMHETQPNTFWDITSGDNKCPQSARWDNEADCQRIGNCQGYTAAPGWDAVTGLGVGNVQEMMAYVNGMIDQGWTGGANNTGATTGLSGNTAHPTHSSLCHTAIVFATLIASFAFLF